MKSLDFLEMLYRLCKVMLPSLTILSKCFQSGAIKVSRIILNVLKTKAELWQLLDNGKTFNLLEDDLQVRLRIWNLQINGEKERITTDIAERYIKAIK